MSSNNSIFDGGDGGMITRMQADFDKVLNQMGYKNGAFYGLTNASTPPLDVLNMLLASPLVTEHEKEKAFRPWKKYLIQYYHPHPDSVEINFLKTILLMAFCPKWSKVFEDDISSRGALVPPTMTQAHNDDRNVSEGHTVGETRNMGRDGTVRITQGRRLGEVPGAPARLNEAQREYNEDLQEKANAPDDSILQGDMDTEEIPEAAATDEGDVAIYGAASGEKNNGGGESIVELDGKDDSKLEALDKKGRREAAKAAKKAAKKSGKQAAASK